MTSSHNLDPLARAELETLAQHWRDVYPGGGSTYQLEAMEVLTAQRSGGRITGDQAAWLYMLIARYANGDRSVLDLDEPAPGS